MTFLKQNKVSTIMGASVIAIALAFGGTVFASHSFEAGVEGSNIPDNTHIRLDGITLEPGDIFPLYDSSPNYVSGHVLLKAPCTPVTDGDDTMKPTVTIVAGHVDELDANTHVEKIPLFYINSVSDAPDSCIWHAHIPDPLNGGAPRITDVDLINLSDEPIIFGSGDVVDLNIQRVLGNIGSNPYQNGPTFAFNDPENGTFNPIFDLNDDDTENDGLGHSSQHGGSS